MPKTIEQLRQELDAKIPRSEIKTRDGGGVTLDYLSSYYVIKRLNEVLGQGSWSYAVNELRLVHAGPFEKKNWKTQQMETNHSAHYLAQVRLTVMFGKDDYVNFEDVGYGDGTDKTMPGKAHELAAKEAVTDAVKRCAKNLGMSLGLALYDKEQENVSEEVAETKPRPTGEVAKPQQTQSDVKTTKTNASEEQAKRLIKQSFEVLNAKKATTKDKFVVTYLKPHGAEKVDTLNADQTASVLAQLKSAHPELGL